MAADGQRYTHGVAIILNIAAIILCSVGMFVDKWWVDETGDFHGIFTIITCQEGVCVLGISSTDSWIVFLQAIGLLELVMLVFSFLTQVVLFVKVKRIVAYVSLGSTAIACLSSMLQIFVASGKYQEISEGYMATVEVPKNRVLYLNAAIGYCAISGIICILVAIAIIVWIIKQKNAEIPHKPQIV